MFTNKDGVTKHPIAGFLWSCHPEKVVSAQEDHHIIIGFSGIAKVAKVNVKIARRLVGRWYTLQLRMLGISR